jgi:hypothetical protein
MGMSQSKNNIVSTKRTKLLLACGTILGPLFYAIAIPQMFLRQGFDIRKNVISMLSQGELGWLQVTNFLLTGLLAILCAVGLKQTLQGHRAGTWGSILIGIFGIGMIIAGIFKAPPGFGFPPGTPEGMPTEIGASAALHGIGFLVAFTSLIICCFVFMRYFISLRNRGMATYSAITGIISPLLIILGQSNQNLAGISFALVGAVAFGWLSIVAANLSSKLSKT